VYESEWRLVTGAGRSSDRPYDDCPIGAEEPDGLIFGKTSKEVRDELTALAAAYPNISPMEARREPSSFVLHLHPTQPLSVS